MGLIASAVRGLFVSRPEDPTNVEEEFSNEVDKLKREYANAEVELELAYKEKKIGTRIRKLGAVEGRYRKLIESILVVSKSYNEKNKPSVNLSNLNDLLKEVEREYHKIISDVSNLEKQKILSGK